MDLLVIGQMPPPVHGQAVATQAMVDLLRANDLVLGIRNIARPKGLTGGLRKIWRHVRAAAAILSTRAPAVYLTVNDRKGMILTVALTALARSVGKQVILHHHSSRYLNKSSAMARMLVAAAGSDAAHIHQSPGLCRQLQAQYPGACRLQPFSNVGVLPPILPNPPRTGPLRLGHMSNLCEAKGIGEVIAAFRKLDQSAELIVAGPCADEFAVTTIRSAEAEFGTRFRYLGPVYGDEKEQFFNEIDVFLFPSRYAAETQGIVNLEALGHGKPVVAFSLGCIARDLGDTGGLAVEPEASFSDALARYIPQFLADRGSAALAARRRYLWLLDQHGAEQSQMLALFGASQRALD